MIGNDPRYQAIIDAYRAGELASTAPQYNPIYDIRKEQIAAGDLPEGARFPQPQLDTTATETPSEEGTEGGVSFDPCPPGYQLIDGVCQPDSMFGNDRDQEYTGPKIENGIIEGYQELEPMQQKMGTFYQTLSPAMKAEYEKAASYGRGIQFKRDPQGNIIRIVAKSPTLSQLGGDIAGGLGSMFSGIGDAAQQYISGGGMLGYLANLFAPQQPTVRYGGGSTMTVTETGQPMIPTDGVIPTGIVRPGYPTETPTPSITIKSLPPIVEQQKLIQDIEKADRDRKMERAQKAFATPTKTYNTAYKGKGFIGGR